jgi:hypothetical protein
MSGEQVWEHVRSAHYYQSVLKNMGWKTKDSTVRFGILGKGIVPNYQIEHADGAETTYRGSSHNPDSGLVATFKEANISRPYSFAEVQGLAQSALSKKKA